MAGKRCYMIDQCNRIYLATIRELWGKMLCIIFYLFKGLKKKTTKKNVRNINDNKVKEIRTLNLTRPENFQDMVNFGPQFNCHRVSSNHNSYYQK